MNLYLYFVIFKIFYKPSCMVVVECVPDETLQLSKLRSHQEMLPTNYWDGQSSYYIKLLRRTYGFSRYGLELVDQTSLNTGVESAEIKERPTRGGVWVKKNFLQSPCRNMLFLFDAFPYTFPAHEFCHDVAITIRQICYFPLDSPTDHAN